MIYFDEKKYLEYELLCSEYGLDPREDNDNIWSMIEETNNTQGEPT